MGLDIQLNTLIQDLRESSSLPLVIYTSGTVTYVLYGLKTLLGVSGYPVLRVTETSASHTKLDNAFLLESSRIEGDNGSGTNIELKVDEGNTLLLLSSSNLIYG